MIATGHTSVCMEPLESRRLLSAPLSIHGQYEGSFLHKTRTVPGYYHSLNLNVLSQDRHGLIVGILQARFSKHDAVSINFVSRVVHGTFAVTAPSQNASLNAVIHPAPPSVDFRTSDISISATVTIGGRIGPATFTPAVDAL